MSRVRLCQLLLCLVALPASWGQSISSLQTSFLYSEGPPDNQTAITSGVSLYGGGFVLHVNGTFNPNAFVSLQWLNTATNVIYTPPEPYVTDTRISVTIPNEQFAAIVANPVPVKITVNQTGGSASAFFTINPPVAPVAPFLPAATVGVPYTARYYTGGTGGFEASTDVSGLEIGLSSDATNISGTPTTPGIYTVNSFAADYWGSSEEGSATLVVVRVPGISQVTPSSSGTGAGDLTITVDGSNFVDTITAPGGGTLPGSQVQWKANGALTPLTTTYVSPTRLTAVIPSALMAAPVAAGIVVQQPSPAVSPTVPFTVLAPTISTIVPTSVVAGSAATTLTVNGANFTTNGATGPTVTLNGTPLITTFVNSGQVTAIIPASMLVPPLLTPTVTLSSNQTPSALNQAVTITATVATPTTGTPTGTVTFKDGATTLASNVPLSAGGTAPLITSVLSAGMHNITAVYSGDANFSANTSASFSQAVLSASTGMVLTAARVLPALGSTVAYRITLINNLLPPQGSVSVVEGSTTLCTIAAVTPGTTSSTGNCTVTYDGSDTVHGAGPHLLIASFTPANSNWTAATVALTVQVPPGTATPGTPVSTNGVNYDYGFTTTFTSTMSPAPANPLYSGVVNFFDGTTLIASAVPNSTTGVATSAAVLLTAGTHTITAQYGGDQAYGTSGPSAALTVTVNSSAARPYLVKVINPGATFTNTVPFVVLAPAISSASAVSAAAGSPALPVTLTGANFLAGSLVIFRGTQLTPTSVTSTSITVTLPSTLLTAPGSYTLQVMNPSGVLSNAVTFAVLAPALSGISPQTVPVGSPNFTLTAAGSNFVAGSQIVFNGTALTTTVGATLTATVPTALVANAGTVGVTVTNPGGSVTSPRSFVISSPALSSISPSSVTAGAATFTLTVTGSNFVPGSQVLMDGAVLATNYVSATSLTATVFNTAIATGRTAAITVANPGQSGNVTSAVTFTVIASPLTIVTSALPPGTAGSLYSASVSARGGYQPYVWSASGLPVALFMNPATGVISGALQQGGTFTVNVTVQDAARTVVTAPLSLSIAPPPVSISTSGGLPSGTVGVAYIGLIAANGGSGTYSFSVGSGALPDGLSLASSGAVSGTPKTAGTFSFTVNATDSSGGTGSASLSILINPAPLTLTGPPTNITIFTGTPTTIQITGGGGTPPYRFTPCSAAPPGLAFSTGTPSGTLSGTPTTVGTFSFCMTIADAGGLTLTKTIGITVVEAPVSLTLGGSLAEGKVGIAYSGQISAAGGTGPYTYSGTGLPDGLTLSSSGAVSGTPSIDGQFTLNATVTDSKGATATATFSITITPADIAILTASLPDGTVGVAYSVTLGASGGNKSYTWTITGLPDGLTANAAGVISGTPRTAGQSTVTVSVQDSTGAASARRTTLSLTIQPAALVISTQTVPNSTAGAPYSITVTVTGGTAPFTYSATGLPAGLTISAAGVISGTPTTPGTSTIVVTVKDAAGATVTRSYTVTVALPSTPNLTLGGVGDASAPLQQPRVQVSLGSSFPVDIVVTLTLTFAADSGPDDPSIQFAGGGRTARITIPAGSTNGATDVALQTGSVAGVITITAQMQAAGQDITPSPAPRRTVRIAAAAPVIVTGSVTAVRNASGFTVTLNGYVTDREMTQAIFTFTPSPGSNLQTTTLTVNIDAMFSQYFSSSNSAATGGQFSFTQPFTVTGGAQTIASVTVTLVNRIGQSTPVTVTLN